MRTLNSVMVVVVVFLLSVSARSYAVSSAPRENYCDYSAKQQESIGQVATQHFSIQPEVLLSTLDKICAKKNMNKFCKQNLVTITLSDSEAQIDSFSNYLCASCVLVKN